MAVRQFVTYGRDCVQGVVSYQTALALAEGDVFRVSRHLGNMTIIYHSFRRRKNLAGNSYEQKLADDL